MLLVFLLKKNPSLHRRWPRFKLEMVRFMSRSVALWKLRGVLCAATKADIQDAYENGLFWNRDLLDSVVRVIRLRQWHKTPEFAGIFRRRCKLYYNFITLRQYRNVTHFHIFFIIYLYNY